MAISVLKKSSPLPFNGGNSEGMFIQFFNCAFSTTDLTGTVPSGMRKVLFRSAFAVLEEAGFDEVITYNNTNAADGTPTLGTGQTIAISRGAVAPTSGLKFGFFILGLV